MCKKGPDTERPMPKPKILIDRVIDTILDYA